MWSHSWAVCVHLEVLKCHMHSAAKLKDPAPGIIMQPAPAKSAQQLCSAWETNCEAFPAIFLNGCKSLEKSTFFYPPLHAASSPSSEQVAAQHSCSLKAIIISSPFPTKASANPTFEQIPQCEREIILWHLRQVGLTGSLLPGRVRASESLVGRSSGDGVRLRKGRGVLRQPVCTPTPEPTAVTRGETKERKNRERRGRKKKKKL